MSEYSLLHNFELFMQDVYILYFLQDGSRSLGLFRNDQICILTKFHRTDLVIYSHSRERGRPYLIAGYIR